jgi:hypothetical protein
MVFYKDIPEKIWNNVYNQPNYTIILWNNVILAL